jgi:hypothetical protein
MAELRQLQADRHLNARLNMDVPGVARVRDILESSILARKLDVQSPAPRPSVAEVETRITNIMTKEQELNETNLKIQTHFDGGSLSLSPEVVDAAPIGDHRRRSLGRNTTCPCGSDRKYKRCCGQNAPAVYAAPPPERNVSDAAAARLHPAQPSNTISHHIHHT